MAKVGERVLAVLIDGENISSKVLTELLAEVAGRGCASVKRIYGDWTKPDLKGWKECLLEQAIQPVQQFAHTTGKNATDGALIIDAMDLLHSGRFSGFCLVSSDSDFTRLAVRIREQGVAVYGFGYAKTPRSFVAACDAFFRFDAPGGQNGGGETEVRAVAEAAPADPSPAAECDPATRDRALTDAVRACSQEGGWVNLSSVGSHLASRSPPFHKRGSSRLSELVAASPALKVKRVVPAPGKNSVVMVRLADPAGKRA